MSLRKVRIGFFLNVPMYNYVISGKWPMVIALFRLVALMSWE